MNAHALRIALSVALLLLAPWGLAEAASPAPPAGAPKARQLSLAVKPRTGDFDQLVERRLIRVLVPYSRTLFFQDKGRERGLTAELVRDFERYINQKHAKQLGKRPVTVMIIATTRDKLLSHLTEGLGDIAAGNLTATPERLALVDFVAPPDQRLVAEIVLTGPKSPAIASVEDLAGKVVHVRPASSYHDSLVALNERFAKAGKPGVQIIPVPDALEDEDMMEMLNAGLLELIVVDDWKARMWAQILPKITLHPEVTVREGGKVGWAFRKDSPKLAAAIEDFYKSFVKRQGVHEYRLKHYMNRVKQVKDSTANEEWKRFEQTLALFERYGAEYHFDPLMLAAQGYQESQLDQNAKSHCGAIGVMQLMPATGKEMKVGDVRITEANIHAGVKYMDQLMSRCFADASFSENDRTLFAFASYNAGPRRIAQMRKEAAARGLDPDQWFNHVELVVAEKVGQETTTYVRNIYKYYVAYKLTLEAHAAQQKAREQLAPAGG